LEAISKKIYKGGSAELKNRNAAKQRGGSYQISQKWPFLRNLKMPLGSPLIKNHPPGEIFSFLTPLEINFLGCLNFKIVDHF